MDKDIKESKEYRLAKDWEMAVNNYGFNPARFAAAIPCTPRCSKACTGWLKSASRSWRMTVAVMTNGTKPLTKKRNVLWNISTNTDVTYH